MSRFHKLLQQSFKPGLESEDAPKVEEAPLSPTEEITATPEAKVEDEPVAETEAKTPVAEPEVCSEEEKREVEVNFEDDGEIVAEVVEAEAELDKGNDAMDQLQGVSERLAVTETRLEDSLADGGLEPQAAQFMQDAVQADADSLGEEIVVPATESFGGESMRYQATVASLEAVKEFAGRVGEAIKKVWAKVVEFLKGLFAKLVQFFSSIKRRNEELKKRAAALTGRSVTGEDKVDLGGTYAKIAVGTEVSIDAYAKLPTLLDDSRKFDESFDSRLQAAYASIGKLSSQKVDVNSDEGYEALTSHLSAQAELPAPSSFSVQDGDSRSTPVLPGNVVITLRPTLDGSEGIVKTMLKLLGGAYRVEREQKEVSIEDTKADVLSQAEIKRVADITDAILKAGEAIATQKGYDKMIFKDLQFGSEVDDNQKKLVSHLTSAYAKQLSYAHQASAKVLTHATRTAAQFQNYGFKSVEAYS